MEGVLTCSHCALVTAGQALFLPEPRGSVSVIRCPKRLLWPSASGELGLHANPPLCNLCIWSLLSRVLLREPPLHLECKVEVLTWICRTADSLRGMFLRGLLPPGALKHQWGSARCPECFWDLIPQWWLYMEGPRSWKPPSQWPTHTRITQHWTSVSSVILTCVSLGMAGWPQRW